jgi:F-type H+-transporting ATPase subunit a
MQEQISIITVFVNHYLGHYALALLSALHIKPESPEMPIPQHVIMAALVVLVGTVLALILRSRLSVERPGSMQQIAELLITNPMGLGIRDILDDNIAHGAREYLNVVGSVGLFILIANLFSVFPLFSSPTGNHTVPLACAIITFLHFNWAGIRRHGAGGYLKLFAGPVWWMSWLLFPVEVISTLARLLSLTVRLFANILSSDLIYLLFLGLLTEAFTWGWEKSHLLGVFMGLFPAIVALVFIVLQVFVAFVQAFIFTILPAVYLGMATAEEH